MMNRFVVISLVVGSLHSHGIVCAALDSDKGLSFTRNIDEIPGSFDLVFDGHPCKSQDEHGDNDCHFDWGADVTGGYKLEVDRDIDEGDTMVGHFKVNVHPICVCMCVRARTHIYIHSVPLGSVHRALPIPNKEIGRAHV